MTVTLKQGVSEGSSAFRHMVEMLVRILTRAGLGKDLDAEEGLQKALRAYRSQATRLRILYLVSDGGPDHNVRHTKTRVTLEVLRWALGIDLLVAMNTDPGGSYKNPVERCMTRINMALYGVGLSRPVLDEPYETAYEKLQKNLDTLRTKVADSPEFGAELYKKVDSISQQLELRFQRLPFKRSEVAEGYVQTACAANPSLMSQGMKLVEDWFEVLTGERQTFDAMRDMTVDKLKKALHPFVENHHRVTHYLVQIRSCGVEGCPAPRRPMRFDRKRSRCQ